MNKLVIVGLVADSFPSPHWLAHRIEESVNIAHINTLAPRATFVCGTVSRIRYDSALRDQYKIRMYSNNIDCMWSLDIFCPCICSRGMGLVSCG